MSVAIAQTSGGDNLWRRFVIAAPYLWLLVFFLVPFGFVLKISFSDPIIARPPFTRCSISARTRSILFAPPWTTTVSCWKTICTGSAT